MPKNSSQMEASKDSGAKFEMETSPINKAMRGFTSGSSLVRTISCAKVDIKGKINQFENKDKLENVRLF